MSIEFSFSKNMLIERNHPALAGHFPGNPIVPGVVILDQVIRLWQEQTSRQVQKISHVKFMTVLKPDSNCSIQYHEKNNQKIDFLIIDEAQKIIAKGLFSYER